ncbi:hypothetical protein [Roseivirga sp. E12]|uniref:hypothetical protein n=1 Tax=Roseivirga sp. E12 TaxID=2819237 RepID=UPI001ABC2D1B|nr:hypothetical protein [Roseivirga sp. E12]MBO3697421.1 hypothetical protein [Roseivirga sp. E12]
MRMPSKWFTHEAHLRLAWIHISKYGIETAMDNLCKQIRDYASFLGESQKFNKTLTVAATRAVYHFMLKHPATNFPELLKQEPRLKHSFLGLIKAHYSFDIFNNKEAGKHFLEPDLLPFD